MLESPIEMNKKTTLSIWFLPIAIFLLLLLALQPLLHGHLPWQGDGLLHFVRLAQLERAVRFGDLFPRWTADLGYGYGFPLFNFYAPFSYYVSVIPHLLGLSLSLSLQFSYVLAMVTMGTGMFLWARKVWGKETAVVAVFALVYTPYMLYNLYHRAALAELWGLAWLVVTLWAISGIGERGMGIKRPLIAAISYAFLILSHNITAMIGTPLIIGYLLFIIWQARPHSQLKIHYSLFIILGLALAAFFWLPAFFEKDAVQIENLTSSANFTYENHFLTLKELFAWPQAADSALVNPPIPRSLSWPILLLALFAWLPPFRRGGTGGNNFGHEKTSPPPPFSPNTPPIHHVAYKGGIGREGAEMIPPVSADVIPRHPAPTINPLRLALTLVTVALILMALPISKPIWDNISLLQFVQFPWRFLGPATITLALLAALGAQNLSRRLPAAIVHLSAITLICLFALPWLFPSPPPPLPTRMTPIDTINFEAKTGWLGTTAAADYLPRTVHELPAPDSLIPRYETVAPDGLIDRLQTPIAAEETQDNLTDSTLVYEIEEKTAVSFLRFSFLGWRGWIDGEPITLGVSEPHGLITAVLPAGSHTFELKLTNTPLQTAANIISAIALLITTYLFITRRSKLNNSLFSIHYSLFLPVILLVVLKTAVFNTTSTPFHRIIFDGQTITAVDTPLHLNFGNQLMLLGADVPIAPTPADEIIDITLFWRALPPVDKEYSVSVQVVDENNRTLAQSDSFHPAGMPLPRWQAGEYGRDHHQLTIPPATPPGVYQLRLFVYGLNDGVRLDMLNGDGLPIGNAYDIGQISIAAPTTFPDPADIEIGQRLAMDVAENVDLLGFDQPFEQVESGQILPLALYWHTLQTPTADYEAIVTLDCGEQGIVGETTTIAPDPTWQAGQILRADSWLWIQPITSDGVPLTDASCELMLNDIYLQTVTLTAPPHVFTTPSFTHPSGVGLGDVATLQGYDVIESDTDLDVTLFWQADGVTDGSYTVFVQMIDENGRLLTQQDHIPAAGTRPTTGWVPAEFIRDAYTLSLPADGTDYNLIVGMYNTDTLQRIPLRDQSGDSITLLLR